VTSTAWLFRRDVARIAAIVSLSSVVRAVLM
jgi:hypothetical protein